MYLFRPFQEVALSIPLWREITTDVRNRWTAVKSAQMGYAITERVYEFQFPLCQSYEKGVFRRTLEIQLLVTPGVQLEY